MATKEILRIAPTLSAEERVRMILPDLIKLQAGKEPLLTEAEMDAIRTCPRGEVLDSYNHRILLFGSIYLVWLRDWNQARTRVELFGLILLYELDRAWRDSQDTDDGDPFDLVRDMARNMERSMKEFYAYREAIPLLEKEFYGMPFFSEKVRASIERGYEGVAEEVARYNEIMRDVCASKCSKLMAESTDVYLIKEGVPDLARADAIIQNIIGITKAYMTRR